VNFEPKQLVKICLKNQVAFLVHVHARFEILDLSLYSFVQESIQGRLSEATLVKNRLLETPDPQIGSSVIAFGKDKQWKVFSVNLRLWARGFKHMRREMTIILTNISVYIL